MSNSGLENILETIFAKNSIDHIMSGKIIYRVIKGHIIVDSVLNGLLLSKIFHDPISTIEKGNEMDSSNATDMLYSKFEKLHEAMMGGGAMEEVLREPLDELEKLLSAQKEDLQSSKIARFWLQFMSMVDILKRYIKAERLGNHPMHLCSFADLLKYLAAAGHNNYTKSGNIYLQQVHELEMTHPDVLYKFSNGLLVVRRSDRFWAGIPSDQVIEQCLMRNLKTSGGLTHGSGMNEEQRNVWTLSMPLCASAHQAIQELTNTTRKSGEQHTEMGLSRISRDWKDTRLVAKFLQERNPF